MSGQIMQTAWSRLERQARVVRLEPPSTTLTQFRATATGIGYGSATSPWASARRRSRCRTTSAQPFDGGDRSPPYVGSGVVPVFLVRELCCCAGGLPPYASEGGGTTS
jgi:hypothetical protein